MKHKKDPVYSPTELAARLSKALSARRTLAKDIVRQIDANPGYRQELIAAGVSPLELNNLEKLGRGLIGDTESLGRTLEAMNPES